MQNKCRGLMEQGAFSRLLAWKTDPLTKVSVPALFTDAKELSNLQEQGEANLSKLLLSLPPCEGRTGIILKPCDGAGLALLLAEHRIERDALYLIGLPCSGQGEPLPYRCQVCNRTDWSVTCDIVLEQEIPSLPHQDSNDAIRAFEQKPVEERFRFWQEELSRCIRCNACRNACPACSCIECLFDNDKSAVSSKVSSDSFEDRLYHIIRSFHVTGRCVECGECDRVCPQKLPLYLLHGKMTKDLKEWYDDPTLTAFTPQDREPEGGNA